MFPALTLALSLLGGAFAAPSTTWLSPQRSAIVKLDIPGYPLWLMDKANAPMMQSASENFYWEQDTPSAVLLNLTMSLDNKTLLLNHHAILPMENGNMPPMIAAYQVPAETTPVHIESLAETGLLNRQWEGLTLSFRYLALDYDRLVWADPESGPYDNHVPRLRFRILGLGAHSRSDRLDVQQQTVLHVTLADQNHGSSGAPERSYRITEIKFESVEDSYVYAPAVEPEQEACSLWSWKCADKGLYQNGGHGGPAYRYIWRARFDEYGRVGSLRHAVFREMGVLKRICKDAGPAMMTSFGVLMVPSMLILAVVMLYRRLVKQTWDQMRRSDAFDDSVLGEEGFGEKYVDADDDEDEVPRPSRNEETLIDLEAGEA